MTSTGLPTFTPVMDGHEDLDRRLHRLAAQAPAADVRAEHVRAMHGAGSSPPPRRAARLAVAGAAIAGFVLGSTGFAMAGALPDPAQGMAHDVLSVVQVDVPDRPANRGACVSEAAKAPTPDAKAEAKAACTDIEPPGRSGAAPGLGGAKERRPKEAPAADRRPEGHPNADTGDCRGKPPWAGRRGGPGPGEVADLAARCPERDDADEPGDG